MTNSAKTEVTLISKILFLFLIAQNNPQMDNTKKENPTKALK
jgi:hypothetical protein